MSNPLPNQLGLTSIADGSAQQAAPVRNNFAAIQTAVNELIVALSGGTSGQVLQAADSADVQWVNGGMVRICDVTLTGSQASFDTNTILSGNIPQTYKHLRAYVYSACDQATAQNLQLRLNNDSSANYDQYGQQAVNGAVGILGGTGATSFTVGTVSQQISPAGVCVVDFLQYTDNNRKFVLFQGYGAGDSTTTASGMIARQGGGHLMSAGAALTRLTFFPGVGNFIAGSRFTLYGMV